MSDQNQISVIIVDDEELARSAIRIYLEKDRQFSVLAECADGGNAINQINQLKPDLVFLDIHIPAPTGIELVAELDEPSPHLVFITAFQQYAVQAFEQNAVDYLLKPLNETRFQEMLEKVKKTIRVDQLNMERVLQTLDQLDAQKGLKRISIKEKGSIRFVKTEEIVWIESAGSYTRLHTIQKMEISNYSISRLEQVLDTSKFIRIHKSHIVNIDCIDSMESYFHGEYIIHMNNGTELKLSRSYKDNLEKILRQY